MSITYIDSSSIEKLSSDGRPSGAEFNFAKGTRK